MCDIEGKCVTFTGRQSALLRCHCSCSRDLHLDQAGLMRALQTAHCSSNHALPCSRALREKRRMHCGVVVGAQ